MIGEIREKFRSGLFEFSKHALDQSIIRQIGVDKIREAIAQGRIIEDYPHDKYGPSCLIFGYTDHQRPIHVQCSYPSRPFIKVVTLYEPDPALWIDCETRRLQK